MTKTIEIEMLRNIGIIRLLRTFVRQKKLETILKLDSINHVVIVVVNNVGKKDARAIINYARGLNDAYFMMTTKEVS